MAKTLTLMVWCWKNNTFAFPFPAQEKGIGDFRKRIGTIVAAEGLHDIFSLWLPYRVRDCILYEDTERCRENPPTLPLAIHIAVSDNSEIFLGMAYDWRRSILHLMGLWHVSDTTEQMFIDAAKQEFTEPI